MPAGDAPDAADKPPALQAPHDFLDEMFRNAAARSEFRSGQRSVIRLAGQPEQQMERVECH
jgi:hypothetical protein